MNPFGITLPLFLLFPLAGLAKAQTQAKLIGDLGKTPNLALGSIPRPRILAKIGRAYLLSAWSQDTGEELFRSEGTPQNTSLVRDIFPGPGSSSPRYLGRLGKLVYLLADDPVRGRALWVSDGTSLGTRFVKTLLPGNPNLKKDAAHASLAIGVKLYFLFEAPGSRFQLWTSDGSVKGTQKIREWRANSSTEKSIDLKNLGGKLFFSFPDNPREAWISDGTTGGTHSLFPRGQLSIKASDPHGSALFGGQVLFIAKDAQGKWGLYSSDGSAKGTKLRLPLGKVDLFDAPNLLALKTHVFFVALFREGPAIRHRLVSLDRQYRPDLSFDLWNKLTLASLMEFQSKALLTFYTRQKTFFSILSDGSKQGTRILIPDHNQFSDAARITTTNQRVLFFSDGPSPKIHAWDPNLNRFESIPTEPDATDFFHDQGRVLFTTRDLSLGAGSKLRALWESDGSKQGTRKWKLGTGFFPTLGSNGIAVIPGQGDRVRLLTPPPPQGARQLPVAAPCCLAPRRTTSVPHSSRQSRETASTKRSGRR